MNHGPAGAYDYYLNETRGNVPEYRNEAALMGLEEFLEFDPVAKASAVTTPTVVVHVRASQLSVRKRRVLATGPVNQNPGRSPTLPKALLERTRRRDLGKLSSIRRASFFYATGSISSTPSVAPSTNSPTSSTGITDRTRARRLPPKRSSSPSLPVGSGRAMSIETQPRAPHPSGCRAVRTRSC